MFNVYNFKKTNNNDNDWKKRVAYMLSAECVTVQSKLYQRYRGEQNG